MDSNSSIPETSQCLLDFKPVFVGSSSPCMVNFFQVFTQDLGETPLSEAAGTLWLQNAAGKVWLIVPKGEFWCVHHGNLRGPGTQCHPPQEIRPY